MMKLFGVVGVVGVVLALSLPLGAQTIDDAIAAQFYPQSLDAEFGRLNAPTKPVVRLTTMLRVDLDRTGKTDYLAVAYSNGVGAALRLIKGTTVATSTLVGEAPDSLLGGGGRPRLDAVDIDNDGVPELVVRFMRASWIFKYKAGALALFCPTATGASAPTCDLGTVSFADLDGDGVLELLEHTPQSDPPYVVWKLDGTSFTRSTLAPIFCDWFQRDSGAPVVITRRFGAAPGAYTLRVINGDQKRSSIVTAGEIRLNGVTVVAPNDLKTSPRTLNVPVRLLDSNVLTVELESDPGSLLSIAVLRGQSD